MKYTPCERQLLPSSVTLLECEKEIYTWLRVKSGFIYILGSLTMIENAKDGQIIILKSLKKVSATLLS